MNYVPVDVRVRIGDDEPIRVHLVLSRELPRDLVHRELPILIAEELSTFFETEAERTEPIYERAFMRMMTSKTRSKAQRRELARRRNFDGSYPMPRSIDPTLREP